MWSFHLVYLPPPTRTPPNSVSSHSCSCSCRLSRTSEMGGFFLGRSLIPRVRFRRGRQYAVATRPEVLRLRSSNENTVRYEPKQLLSLSPSHRSTPPRRLSAQSLKEKETLALRTPPKIVNNVITVCLYCYQSVCTLYSLYGQQPPHLSDGGDWRGHVMKRGDPIECPKLLDIYRINPRA